MTDGKNKGKEGGIGRRCGITVEKKEEIVMRNGDVKIYMMQRRRKIRNAREKEITGGQNGNKSQKKTRK